MRSLWNSRNSMHVVAACVVIVMMRFAAPLLLPIVLSVMLFYMLDPVVDYLERWHLPRLLGPPVAPKESGAGPPGRPGAQPTGGAAAHDGRR